MVDDAMTLCCCCTESRLKIELIVGVYLLKAHFMKAKETFFKKGKQADSLTVASSRYKYLTW